jgi:replication-associated recombination protein RarA
MKAKPRYNPKKKSKAGATPLRPQHEDVWSRCQSVNGYAIDELRSVLQKSIRRGLLEEAMLAAYEFYLTGPETEELLWRRLEIIATEDVGYGLIMAPVLLESLNAQRLRIPPGPDRWFYSAHAVRLLATARKDRTSMELGAWAEAVTSRGERKVVVHDYQVDFHTRRGTLMGRGRDHWWHSGGAVLLNQIEGLDSRWGDYLLKLNPPSKKTGKKA